MKTKTSLFGIVLFIMLLLFSCSEKDDSIQTLNVNQDEITQIDNDQLDSTKIESIPIKDTITVMVIPCSNGYEYNLKIGDLTPSLEKYLKKDKRILLKPFPLKKMNGSGYFGVYDKKYCSDILNTVDVDFLIMTQMKGMDLIDINWDTGNWGYETKILNVSTMHQFLGIKSENLESFEKIDSDIERKLDNLIELIIESSESK